MKYPSVLFLLIYLCMTRLSGSTELYLGITNALPNGHVDRFDDSATNLGTLVDGLGITSDMAFDSLGNLYFLSNLQLHRYDPRTSQISTVPTVGASGLPISLAIDKQNRVYVGFSNAANSQVKRLGADGSDMGTFVHGIVPVGLAFDNNNHLYIADAASTVHRVDRFGQALRPFVQDISEPRDLAVDGADNLYISTSDGSIKKISPEGTILGTIAFEDTPTLRVRSRDLAISEDQRLFAILSEDVMQHVAPFPPRVVSSVQRIVEFADLQSPVRDVFTYDLDGEAGSIAIRPISIDRIDLDNNGALNTTDIDALTKQTATGSNLSSFDLTSDGQVDRDDIQEWLQVYGTIEGDADLNQEVNLDDFFAFASSFGGTGRWTSGDFDGDGEVRFPDFVVMSSNFGRSVNGRVPTLAAVPEPSTFSALTTASLVLLFTVRSCSRSC